MFVVLHGDEKIAVGIRGKGENCATTGERKKGRSWWYLGDTKREGDIKGLGEGTTKKSADRRKLFKTFGEDLATVFNLVTIIHNNTTFTNFLGMQRCIPYFVQNNKPCSSTCAIQTYLRNKNLHAWKIRLFTRW